MKTLCYYTSLILIPFVAYSPVSAVPVILNYQGEVTVEGIPFSGTGYFRFALVSEDGSTFFWTNDGNSVPLTDIELAVEAGIFNIDLGDPEIMNVIPPAIFNNDSLYLRIWFNDGETGMQRLIPDRRIVTSGYAVKAVSCVIDDDVPDDDSEVPDDISIDNGNLYAPSSGTMVGIGTAQPHVKLSLGTDVTSKKLAIYDGEGDFYGFGLETGRLNILAGNSVRMSILSNSRVGIGTNDPATNLEIHDTGNTMVQLTSTNHGAPSLLFKRSGNSDTDWRIMGDENLTFCGSGDDGNTWYEWMRLDAFGNLGIGTSSPTAKLHVNGNIKVNNKIQAVDASGIGLASDEGSVRLFVHDNGNIGIGTISPTQPLEIAGTIFSSSGGFMFPDDSVQLSAVDGHSLDANDGTPQDAVYVDNDGNVGIGTSSPETKLQVNGSIFSSSGGFRFPDDTIQTTACRPYALTARDGYPETAVYVTDDGDIGIGTLFPPVRLSVAGGTDASLSGGGFLLLGNENQDNLVFDTNEIIARNNSAPADLHIQKDSGNTLLNESSGGVGIGTTLPASHKLVVYSDTTSESESTCHIENGSGYSLTVKGNSTCEPLLITQAGAGNLLECDSSYGTDRTVFTVRQDGLYVRGNITIASESSGDTVVEIGEGLDYAEGFDISSNERPEPGTVLVIDENKPGRLIKSTEAYDRKVAGVVAGAGGIHSGVRLGSGAYDCNVALAGRVYCNVEGFSGAIRTGDLLTTSDMDGYAMRARDFKASQGAILGKAMEPLPENTTGRILVLITLQ